MFNMLKKQFRLIAPISGKVLDLSRTPDPVFAQKLVGDGVAIEPTGDRVVAPVDGTLSLIFRTNHGFGITMDNGIEILVHIGIDTVELEGKGFVRMAVEGQKVKAGEPIIAINPQMIKENGYSLITLLLITNVSEIHEIKYNIDVSVEAGKDIVMSYKK